MLEILNGAFVFFRRAARGEGPQVTALAGPGIGLPRIQPKASRLQFADHVSLLY